MLYFVHFYIELSVKEFLKGAWGKNLCIRHYTTST